MTSISAVMARSYSPDMFADLGLWPVREWDKASGVTTLVFDGDLDAPIVAAIRARMTSRDDADQAARANLAALRDSVTADPSLENVAALATAVAAYVLGAS